jgi:hypothetical protein
MTSIDDSGAAVLPEAEREVLTWDTFGVASRELAQTVVDSGGLLLAGSIAYALGAKACGALNVEFYTGIGTVLPEPVVLPPMLDEGALHGKNVLLVDDVSDSGRTLAKVVDLISEWGANVKTVCLYTKPRTIMVPDYEWRRTDKWITFPWSDLPPVEKTVSGS